MRSTARSTSADRGACRFNLASINQRQLKAFKVFQAPRAEQRRIVSELDALQAEVDGLKRLPAETPAELDALLPAILNRAFKGHL